MGIYELGTVRICDTLSVSRTRRCRTVRHGAKKQRGHMTILRLLQLHQRMPNNTP